MPDIAVWHRCNSNCIMCTNMDSFIDSSDSHYCYDFQMRRMRRFKRPAYFLFTGGEPTLHPKFLEILAEFKKEFPRTPICLLTNGRRLCYPDFAGEVMLLGKRNFDAAVSIHGYGAGTHDSITRSPGSFSQAVKGLHNLFKLRGQGQDIEIRIVLHRLTAPWLEKILAFLLRAFPDTAAYRVTLIYFEAEGQAEKNFRHLRLSLTECVSRIEAAGELLGRFAHFRLYHFPLCVLPGQLRRYVWKTVPPGGMRYPGKCRPCVVRKDCMGLQKWYAGRFGEEEIKPLSLY